MATQTKDAAKSSAQYGPGNSDNGQAPVVEVKEISERNRRAIEFLDSLDNATPEEIQEQKETWAFLKKALDEDRLSPNRPHFPDETDGSL